MTRGSLFLTAAIGLIVATCSCAGTYRTRAMIDRTAYASSYRLAVMCLTGPRLGSAVAISPRHMLTAKHVVECDGAGPVTAFAIGGGKWTEVTVDRWGGDGLDAVRLVAVGTASPFRDYSHVSTRLPRLGETLCIIGGDVLLASSIRKCGDVAGVSSELMIVSLHVVQGNSGGPVFDANGDVLGIVNRGRWASEGEFVMLGLTTGALGDLAFPAVTVELE